MEDICRARARSASRQPSPFNGGGGGGTVCQTCRGNYNAPDSVSSMCNGGADESATTRLRQELDTLMNELQDRDRELAEMVAVQRTHFQAWEKDQQLVIAFKEKCAQIEDELSKDRASLSVCESELQALQEQHRITTTMLNRALDELKRLSGLYRESQTGLEEHRCSLTDLEGEKRELEFALSQQRSKISELQQILDSKEKEQQYMRAKLAEMEDKIHCLEQAVADYEAREFQLKREVAEARAMCGDARSETDRIREQLASMTQQLQDKCAELNDIRGGLCRLKDDLTMAGEREERQYHIINSQRCKQQRTHEELRNLRVLYEAQQKELSCLQEKLTSMQC